MRIRYNTARIMAKANEMVREQLVRDQQFTSVGQKPPHTPLRSLSYCLKVAWGMAKCARYEIEDGVTAGSFFSFIVVVED